MLKLGTVALVAILSLSPPVGQDVAALKREIEQLKAQQAAMQKDLDAIKSFLQQLLRAPEENKLVDATVAIAGEPSKGPSSAKVTLVEVSDYHCPFCRRHMQQTQPQIDAEYINSGKIQYVFIDYPIQQLHPDAFKSHEAANCASDQGKYWEMHAKLFAAPTKDPSQLVGYAQELGMDASKLRACLDGGKYAKPVRESVARMEQLGIDSTPTFLIGLTPAAGQPMKVVKVVKGAMPFAEFRKAIDGVLTP
jgi:protein-disulfide isomerase